MAPKRQRKDGASTSAQAYDNSRFVSYEAQQRYYQLMVHKRLCPERGIGDLINAAPYVNENIQERGWNHFVAQPEAAVVPLVREFYANAAEMRDFKIFVRGKQVSISKKRINAYYKLPTIQNDEYSAFVVGNANLQEVITRLAGANVQWKSHRNQASSFRTKHMDESKKIWFRFICAKLLPTTHVSDVTVERALLLYAIVTMMTIDVGSIIRDSILHIVGGSTTSGLGHPSLICALCAQANVTMTSDEEFQHPMSILDRSTVRKFFRSNRSPHVATLPTPVEAPPPSAQPTLETGSSSSTPLWAQQFVNAGGEVRKIRGDVDKMQREVARMNLMQAQQNEVHNIFRSRVENFMDYSIQFNSSLAQMFSQFQIQGGPTPIHFPQPPVFPEYPSTSENVGQNVSHAVPEEAHETEEATNEEGSDEDDEEEGSDEDAYEEEDAEEESESSD